jgi:hypothetical protein
MELLKSGKQYQECKDSHLHFTYRLTNQPIGLFYVLFHILQISFLRMEVKMTLKFVAVQFKLWSWLWMKLEHCCSLRAIQILLSTQFLLTISCGTTIVSMQQCWSLFHSTRHLVFFTEL